MNYIKLFEEFSKMNSYCLVISFNKSFDKDYLTAVGSTITSLSKIENGNFFDGTKNKEYSYYSNNGKYATYVICFESPLSEKEVKGIIKGKKEYINKTSLTYFDTMPNMMVLNDVEF